MEIDALALAARWAHILSAIVAVGGTVFARFVLMPAAAQTLDDDAHGNLRLTLTARWQKIIHVCILLFLLSGFYNYLAITRFQHVDQPLYHMLFGIKFLLALAVFVLAVGLTSNKAWAAGLRANARRWMALLVVLAVAVVLLSSVMRGLPRQEAPALTPSLEAPAELSPH
jgi:uncharacterized membrane protein